MTGAGSATLAFGKEQSFGGDLVDADSDNTPEYYAPGRNATVTNLELSNALSRQRAPDDVEPAESYAMQLDGALAIEATVSADTFGDVLDIVFNDGGSAFTTGYAASSKWFLGVDYLEGVCERVVSGVVPTEFALSWTQNGMLRYTLTCVYQDEEKNTAITPSNIVQVSDGSSVPFHDASLTIDATAQTHLQSFTLTISNIARLRWGEDRTALDAVIASPEPTLSATTTFVDEQTLDLAYGGGSGSVSSTQQYLDSVSGTITASANGTTVAEFQLPKLKPDTYTWENLVNADEDLTEPVDYHVNGGVTVA